MVTTIESVASVAGRGPQRDDGSQPWHYTRHWVYENLTEKVKTEIPD